MKVTSAIVQLMNHQAAFIFPEISYPVTDKIADRNRGLWGTNLNTKGLIILWLLCNQHLFPNNMLKEKTCLLTV